MINIEKFGKVTHDNLPQAVEHLINMMSVQVEQQIESDSSPYLDSDDEIDIKQASVLLKKSQSTIYRYTWEVAGSHLFIVKYILHFSYFK